ncbi:hypothetical protein OXB_0770 [Bacillus sp. OxB-1]|uniref:Uma2 family endonuclease n=1 Tax=Bacillus sp. (strain OxB-1) TaxID=98228 RepID=UPI000581D768|nr:Uma2 family endonuclease [Bacillus sp. OxB-1]BAQ09242.1 hypothetical protein OXB_0770 [Bacillus sp. OxB-1]
MAQSSSDHRMTVAEISERDGYWELIDGTPYNMTPAPSPLHQRVVGELFFSLRSHYGKGDCSVYMAPFDVQLDETDPYTLVQPDISVFCNQDWIGDKRAIGAPELVVEVLSPATALRDRNHKFNLYERTAISEYWLVDPVNKTIEVYGLAEGRYRKRAVFGKEDSLTSFHFRNLDIDLDAVFSD